MVLEAEVGERDRVKTVLHVGCGGSRLKDLPPVFQQGWKEVRLDIDKRVEPDIVASIVDMGIVEKGCMDAVFSAHNLEHLYTHQVPHALKEFYRVLKPGGFLFLTVPDLQQVMEAVLGYADGSRGNGNEGETDLEKVLYQSAAGPISAIDVLFGFRPALEQGVVGMAHKTGFTGGLLMNRLREAGFKAAPIHRGVYCLWTIAGK